MSSSVSLKNLEDVLEYIEALRLASGHKQNKDIQATLGQFFTPAPIAQLMVSMLECSSSTITILDAGAGIGSLFATCVACLCYREKRPQRIEVTAYEIDATLINSLYDMMNLCKSLCEKVAISFHGEIHQSDFLTDSLEILGHSLFTPDAKVLKFNCVILNPPYKKIQNTSKQKRILQKLGIETTNLYTGFISIGIRLLAPDGEIVAITPRSFCNGPYFKHFRQHFLQIMSLQHLHTFNSRTEVFKGNAVLQENIIFHAVKNLTKAKSVFISSSSGAIKASVSTYEVGYDEVVHPEDPQSFIHVVQDKHEQQIARHMLAFRTSLEELGLSISTGKVVDFRVPTVLRTNLDTGTIPLLFPTHVAYGAIIWPKPNGKKPNALLDVEATKILQVPNGYYVLVKRFSAKEEKRRIIAATYEPRVTTTGSKVSFENHLNYFHHAGQGISPNLAKGLTAYLNSSLVDTYFRQFNGHTQVNATDLRNIRYPTYLQLERLGDKIPTIYPSQTELDKLIQEEFFIYV